jgi:hypothetical protein
VNAIHWADVNAGLVLRADTGFGDRVSHGSITFFIRPVVRAFLVSANPKLRSQTSAFMRLPTLESVEVRANGTLD